MNFLNNNKFGSLSILVTNSNGLNKSQKIDNLLNFSKTVKADILITTETHWKDTEPTTNPKLKRWSITQSSNNAAHASGGVAVWCRQNFIITNKFISERMVSVDIERNNHKFRIIAIYGPTGDTAIDFNEQDGIPWR